MSSGAEPAKKRPPIVFKHRATPTPSAESSQPPGSQDAGTDSVALFRRAKEFFPLVFEENKREKEQRRQRQRKQHDEPKRREQSREADPDDVKEEGSGPRKTSGTKRRKVSHEATSESSHPDASPQNGNGDETSPEPSPQRRPDKGKGVATPPSPKPQDRKTKADDSVFVLDDDDDSSLPPVRALDDDDDDDEYEHALERERETDATRAKAEPDNSKDSLVVDDDLEDTADPEFEEYIIRARARDAAARAAQAAQEEVEAAGITATLTAEDGAVVAAEGGARGDIRLARFGSNVSSSMSPPPNMGEQNYRIFLTPHFPEPVPPLVANVRMDQKMIHVQNAFIEHARRKGVELPDDQAECVVLTWKGNKLYTWTTGQSLGIRPDRSGLFREDSSGRGGGTMGLSGFLSGGLHLEIWTPSLYEAFLAEQERQRKRNLGEVVAEDLVSSDEDEGPLNGDATGAGGSIGLSGQPAGDAAGAAPQRVRLVLKSQDYEKLCMTASGDTKVAILVAAFREQRQIPLDRTVYIYWDGERLDEDSTVADAEMEDMDTVEVYVR